MIIPIFGNQSIVSLMHDLARTLSILLITFFIIHDVVANQDSLLNLIETTSADEDKIELYLELSRLFQDKNADSSLFFAGKALGIAVVEENNNGIASAYFTLGKIQLRRDSILPARDDFYKALSPAVDCECKELQSEILLYLGKSYSIQDNYFEAIDYLMQSLKIAEEIQLEVVLSDIYDDIGMLLMILEDYEQSMSYFEKALDINSKTNNKRDYATTLRNIGFNHVQVNELEQAEKDFEKAFEIYASLGDDWGMATAMIGEGDVEYKMENYDSALIIYQRASNIAANIDIRYKESGPLIQAYCFNRLGETHLKLGQYKEALSVLRKSADMSEEFTMPGRKADAAKVFSQIYEREGNTSLALDYYKLFDQLSDSIVNAKNVSRITKLEMEYQYMKRQKEQEIVQIKKDSAYQSRVLFYQMVAILSILAIAGLFIILFLYRKNQKNNIKRVELSKKNLELEKAALQNELDFKNKELATNVMYLLKKNNFIATVSKKLKEINLKINPTNRKSILEVVRELEANMSKESWEEFEYRFNDVHNNFYEKLIGDFPDLTPNELKLCAFLKLNMTSKDISTITYTTPQSITVARHRLRSKLGLSRDDNLVTFLAKY